MVIGHADQQARLRQNLPRVSLLVGPYSVGKTTLAFEIARAYEVHDADLLRFKKLTVDDARAIVQASQTPPNGSLKVLVIDLDYASEAALNVLLKALEESPESTRFILIAQEVPMETITSRSTLLRFPLLTDEQVEDILLRRKFAPAQAKNLAGMAKGQVRPALQLASNSLDKIPVLAALKALRDRDEDALSALASRWTEENTTLLSIMAHEVISTRWRIFQAAEVEGTPTRLALLILTALRQNVRPRLVIHSSLMTILKENR